MTSIGGFKLEITRPGPLYGQLLSRLTNYIALCDGVEADTVRLPFDHYEIKADLASLRYFVGSGGGSRVPNELRAAAVERLSQRVCAVIAQMPGFQTRMAETCSETELTHLRLILGGGELALIPFELSSLPSGWRGAGGKLSLQSRAPIVLTRELRDSSRMALQWNRRPRILFCTATPEGFASAPAQAHLLAIVRALRPWVDGGREEGRRLSIEDVVTVIEEASLSRIDEATSKHEYTHIHFVCHGCALPNHGERTGLALTKRNDPGALDAVDASELAGVLWCKARGKKAPTMVVLATCDSANQNAVEVPGSSLAYELHQAGVPWVVASQMPLTYRGSATLAETFYQKLFEGMDPRCILQLVRNRLAEDGDAHDWASIVAYGAFPPDFEAQVRAFHITQLRRCIDSAFERMRLESANDARAAQSKSIDAYLEQWSKTLEPRRGRNDPDWSEYWGMKGAICKRKSEFSAGDQKRQLLERAAENYLEAAKAQVGNHWVVVQYLSLLQLLWPDGESSAMSERAGWFEIAERSALLDWKGGDLRERRWAVGSLLELAILAKSAKAAKKTPVEWARDMCDLSSPGCFEVLSTRRQLRRYFEGQFTELATPEIRSWAKQAWDGLPRFPEDE